MWGQVLQDSKCQAKVQGLLLTPVGGPFKVGEEARGLIGPRFRKAPKLRA